MADELELKAVVADPSAASAQFRAAGGREIFRGMMRDRLYDQAGRLTRRGEVLRVRIFEPTGGPPNTVIGWKGPTQRSPEGYKLRREIEYSTPEGARARELLDALGYEIVLSIDRSVEVVSVLGATARLEWYPRMDVLVEIEGKPPAIEAAISASGIPRATFLADPLALFVERYNARERQPAVLAEAGLDGAAPSWDRS